LPTGFQGMMLVYACQVLEVFGGGIHIIYIDHENEPVIIPHGQNTWHSPQKVGEYKAYINQYKVTVPSTFTLV